MISANKFKNIIKNAERQLRAARKSDDVTILDLGEITGNEKAKGSLFKPKFESPEERKAIGNLGDILTEVLCNARPTLDGKFYAIYGADIDRAYENMHKVGWPTKEQHKEIANFLGSLFGYTTNAPAETLDKLSAVMLWHIAQAGETPCVDMPIDRFFPHKSEAKPMSIEPEQKPDVNGMLNRILG